MLSSLSSKLKPVSSKRLFQSFADNHDLVYFGSVSQHDDEHQIVRGMTVSHSHSDSHYCIGTYEGYDASFVERADVIVRPKAAIKKKKHLWHIIQIDLHTKKELPHVFIGLHSHSESFYTQLFTKYPYLRPISIGAIHTHIPAFSMHYRVFSRLSDHVTVEHLLTSTITSAFVQNFGSLAVEIIDGSLYVYSEKQQPTYKLLDTMIKNATWLAGRIDEMSQSID